MRDGRDVVESGVRSFDWDFDKACELWAEGARTVAAAADQGVPFLLVKYEDVFADQRTEMLRILEFLELDANAYDFAVAASLPVVGSSTFGKRGSRVNWEPVPRTADFMPIGRWKSWSADQQETFSRIAGDWNLHFGYDTDHSAL